MRKKSVLSTFIKLIDAHAKHLLQVKVKSHCVTAEALTLICLHLEANETIYERKTLAQVDFFFCKQQ